ncbi:transcriptional regulatory protein [Caballeronia novacaledonica]|uniref:Transcriptional regulatory protein n=1 Tax=Caballeronia novacaledonica TaxID=1544861 RepID=A0A2U3IA79_9BURK|nr:MarR family winged helix-turn-helix transcriptional regulator [Caballeronia novacaledonica]SPB17112.1 transcriptional regulatory protein [Caballeronia novacaledonica]
MNDILGNQNPLERHLGYWMRLVSNEVSNAFARALADRQISVAEWVALNHIASRAHSTSSAIATSIGMTRGAVSKILDKLESKGLVSRVASADDNRVQTLSLTRDARRLLPKLTAIADANDDHFFSVLDESDRNALRALLQKLADLHQIRDIPIE